MCVLGPNGGGKTTLFRTLLGLLPSQAGEVLLARPYLGDSLASETSRAAWPAMCPRVTLPTSPTRVREFVLMGRTAQVGAFAVPGVTDRRVADQALESLGIAHLADQPVNEVSGGERQLALVARALAQEPRLLVLDEPTASLDFGNQVRVLERILALAASGIAILFSTPRSGPRLPRARTARCCSAKGSVLETGAPRDVIRADTLQRLYGVLGRGRGDRRRPRTPACRRCGR